MAEKDQQAAPTLRTTPPRALSTSLGPLALALTLITSLTFASLLWLSSPSPIPATPLSPSSTSHMTSYTPRTLRLGSFNIRMDGSAAHPLLYPFKEAADALAAKVSKRGEQDSRERWGERRWYERRGKVVDQVLFSELDVVGFQEVLDNQYVDLKQLLGEEWEHVGVGRNDGKRAGEAVPVFFRKSRFSLLFSQHFWLSPTPSVPGSVGWDAGQTRMITIVHLRDKQHSSSSFADFIVLNTHWDDRGIVSRAESAALILKLVEEEVLEPYRVRNAAEPLVVLLGDLNSVAEEKGYQVLTGGRYNGIEKAENRAFYDARHELATRETALGGQGAMSGRFGPLNTYTGFLPSDSPKIIDFVMPYSNAAFLPPSSLPPIADSVAADTEPSPTRWKVSRYGVLPSFFEDIGGKRGDEADALLISDHRLVVAAFEEVAMSSPATANPASWKSSGYRAIKASTAFVKAADGGGTACNT